MFPLILQSAMLSVLLEQFYLVYFITSFPLISCAFFFNVLVKDSPGSIMQSGSLIHSKTKMRKTW